MTRGRLEAFSDGVLAIIITIMVLELKVPHRTDPAALLGRVRAAANAFVSPRSPAAAANAFATLPATAPPLQTRSRLSRHLGPSSAGHAGASERTGLPTPRQHQATATPPRARSHGTFVASSDIHRSDVHWTGWAIVPGRQAGTGSQSLSTPLQFQEQ